VLPHPRVKRPFSLEQIALSLLLVVGMCFPSSLNGEHSVAAVLAAFVVLFALLACLVWKFGLRERVAAFISLPMLIILGTCTLLVMFSRPPIDVDLGLFLKFAALGLVFALDLRRFRPGPLVEYSFVLINVLNLTAGFAILIGSEWIAEFLPTYYWTSYPELVPSMVGLHKPVLTFGSHSLAALFVYLFFWCNLESYRVRRNKIALLFAIGYFVLLLGLTSFTSFGFAAIAIAQVGVLSWNRNRWLAVGGCVCLGAMVGGTVYNLPDTVNMLNELPQITDKGFLNAESNGPLSRYGSDGVLRPEMKYLFGHPLAPVGLLRSGPAFAMDSPSHFFIGDSGPLEYLLRGSVPLLLLIYFGLYRFLRHNLLLHRHATILFAVILIFELGFSALGSSRTLFLLPFFVVYLNQFASSRGGQSGYAESFSGELSLPWSGSAA